MTLRDATQLPQPDETGAPYSESIAGLIGPKLISITTSEAINLDTQNEISLSPVRPP
jgi:hypothetical protein